jgi:hypothetical protein
MVTDVFDKEENRQNYVRSMFKTLNKREEQVLRLYLGIDAQRRFTLEELGEDFDVTVRSIKRVKNKGIRKVINRVTNFHPEQRDEFEEHIKRESRTRESETKETMGSYVKNTPLSSHIDKDLIERCVKERGKLLDEFMEQLLYPPREIVEKWVII